MPDLRFRQVHLDFHTSEDIPGIGAKFDPEAFAETLAKARVDSITCFARGHHGWIYYDSKLSPERIHPHLARKNLLVEQIDACHRRGIRVPIYTTVQWDHYTAQRHPEWVVLNAEGKIDGTPPFEAGFYRNLCVNSPYRDFLKAHTKEILQTLPVDGLFFDIVKMCECCCRHCREGMIAEGLDPARQEDRLAYATDVINGFRKDMTRLVRRFNKTCTVFYNAGHVGPYIRRSLTAYTHLELESLPSGFWGYLHFPVTARYARTLGVDCLGMTGKFHTFWGDFHSFKNRAALEFECFSTLAMGAKCSVGDQLHPSGKICRHTYKLIGSVYEQVERKEPWCRRTRPVTEIGVFTPENPTRNFEIPDGIKGATRILQEAACQFDIIDENTDFGKYPLLILPDTCRVDAKLAARLDKYVADGGSMIASFESGLACDGEDFAIRSLGVRRIGPAPFSPDFIVPAGPIGNNLPRTEHVMYQRGLQVRAVRGAKTLAQVRKPYFNRTWEHFCSHRHTPSAGRTAYPGVVGKGRAVYFAHPIFIQYNDNAPEWCKQLVVNAVEMLIGAPLVQHDGPSSVLAALNDQPREKRRVLHLLHYIPERRSQSIDVIKDIIDLHDLTVSVKAARKVRTVRCVPQDQPLTFSQADGRVEFTLPILHGHQMVELR